MNELFLAFLSTNRAAIVPREYCAESYERFAKAPVGTGPFKLVRNEDGICVLEVFTNYFQGRAHLDQVEIWHIPDLYQLTPQKNIDNFQIIHNFRLPDQASASWNQVQKQGTICKFITFNLLKDGPLRHPELRRALCKALDHKQWIEALSGDAIQAMDGFLDKSAQESIIAIAGGKDGGGGYERESEGQESVCVELENLEEQEIELGCMHMKKLKLCTIPQYEADANLYRDFCKQVGIKIDVTLLPLEAFQGDQRLEADLILFAVFKCMRFHPFSVSETNENILPPFSQRPLDGFPRMG